MTATNSILAAVAAVAMFLQGCGAAAVSNPIDLRPFVAVAVAVSVLEPSPQPIPPTPEPKPGDPCEPCRGKGRVGDGRDSEICTKCGGTGIVPQPKPATPAPPASPPAPAPQAAAAPPPRETRQVWRTICEGGVCRRVLVTEEVVR